MNLSYTCPLTRGMGFFLNRRWHTWYILFCIVYLLQGYWLLLLISLLLMSFNANASMCWDENPFSVYFYTSTDRLHLPQSILHLAMPRANIAKSINSSSRLDFRIPLWFKVRGLYLVHFQFFGPVRGLVDEQNTNRLRSLIHIPIYKNQVRRLVARLLRCNLVHPF